MRRPRGPRYDEAPRSLGRPPTICVGLADPAIMKPRAPWAGQPRGEPGPRTSVQWAGPPRGGSRGAGVRRRAEAGGGMLAVKRGAPVVPVYISGSGRAWPRGQRLFRPAKVTVAFGPPLRFDGGRRAEGHRRTQYETASRAMMAAIARLKDSAATDGTRVVVRAAGRRGAGAPPPEASL